MFGYPLSHSGSQGQQSADLGQIALIGNIVVPHRYGKGCQFHGSLDLGRHGYP